MTANPGGVESFIINYAQHLKSQGILFDYVDLQGYGLAHSQQIAEAGSKIYTLKDSRKHPLLAYREIQRIITEGGYGCVHINMLSAANLVPVMAARKCKVQVIVHSHNTQTVGIHRKILHKLNSGYLRSLPVTRLACGIQAGKWMYGKKPFEVIPNAIDTDRYQYNEETRKQMIAEIEHAASLHDSLGGILETAVSGLPAGIGEPMFDSLESRLSHALFSIPAVKGVEFGSGGELAQMYGSEANDAFGIEDGQVITLTNHNGGINGGISNGMPVLFRTVIKPTPSIARSQKTVNFRTMEETEITIAGRHDPAIVHRARVVQDTMTALVLADLLAQHFGLMWLKEDTL
jgi:hypothetical protein